MNSDETDEGELGGMAAKNVQILNFGQICAALPASRTALLRFLSNFVRGAILVQGSRTRFSDIPSFTLTRIMATKLFL